MFFIVGCKPSIELTNDQYILKKEYVESTDKSFNVSFLRNYLNIGKKKGIQTKDKKQQKVILLDTAAVNNRCEILTTVMQNEGYLKAAVDYETTIKDKKATITYRVNPNQPFFIHNIYYSIADTAIANLLEKNGQMNGVIRQGQKFSIENLEQERRRITSFLRDNGYYRFNKDFIHYDADTVRGSYLIDLTLYIDLFSLDEEDIKSEHKRYYIDKVAYEYVGEKNSQLREKVIDANMLLKKGDLFCARKVSQSYNNYSRLHAIKSSNIRFFEHPDTALLDAKVQISTNKINTISVQPEGTNTAGNLGAALSLTYENRNIFKGSETFSLQLRGAFEAITGLEGYQNKDYVEYNVESRLNFPRLIVPFISLRNKLHANATSELSVSFNLQNRPEFHRRVLTAAWRYRWKSETNKYSYKVDLIDLNFISMPWIASTFKENYLDNVHSRNAILRYNYEDLFIMKTGFGMSRSSARQVFRVNVETSGNLLNLMSHMGNFKRNSQSQYTVFNIAFAQYVKGDFEYSYALPLSTKSSMVFHAAFGIAYPYGNSKVLPFEKRYFSGGANSVRGWNVRGLGPGRYRSSDGAIDFINQTGDMKLDFNIEYRMPLFWKLNGAVFVDAGNIWTLRSYEEQEGGLFQLENILKQMAVAYGVGLRLNFDYFILRFDLGVKAINPAYTTSKEHYPIINPKISQDCTLHFAVGLPF